MKDALIDNKLWLTIETDFKKKEDRREEIIQLARKIIQESKQIIYALHRGESADIKPIRVLTLKLVKIDDNEPIRQVAFQEYVEALTFFYAVTENRLPSNTELEIDFESYLFGLTDLCGELNRAAVNSAIKKDFKKSQIYKEMVERIYGRMLRFDLRNGELRRKFDGIKYELKKLENLMLELSLYGSRKN